MSRPLKRCFDLTDEDIADALVSREATSELLAELVRVARPDDGAPKILIVFARAARAKCPWLGGPLLVQLAPIEHNTEIRVAADKGGGVLVGVFQKILVPVPFAEFERGLRVAQRVVDPLRVYPQDGKLVLAPNRRLSTHRMPAILEIPRKTAVLDFSALEESAPKKQKR